ncbi:hypothetical protein Tco_1201193 [Tanacetum coccineum]
MTSFDYRLNPIYAIKECSSCGSLYTSNCGCSKGSLEDKILVPIPDSSQRPLKIENFCLDCGDPIHGLHCQGCALIQKTFEEVLQDFQDTSKLSNDNTNVVNAPQEPIVVNQDPGENSSPSPLHIDHCCHECGDSLDGIFCRQCTCKSCGKGAHYGYNCPPRVPIISNPEPCKNQTIGEPLQNLQSLQQQCLLGTCQKCGCNEYDGVCFYCKVGNGTPINVSTPYSSNDSPSVANHPPQPQYVPYSCELVERSHYGYGCQPLVPFVYNQGPLMEQMTTLRELVDQAMQKKEEEKQIAEEQAAEDRYWKIPICYDDDEDNTTAITPVLPIEEPDNSLSMGDEHLDTIPETESGRSYKSIVLRTLSQFQVSLRVFPTKCVMLTLCENTTPLNALNEHSEIVVNSDVVFILQVMDDFPTGEYIVCRCIPPDVSSSVRGGRTFYVDKDHFKERSSGSTTTHAEFSQYDSFIFDLSINPFPPADRSDFNHEEFADELTHIMSLPNLECFKFKIEHRSGRFDFY